MQHRKLFKTFENPLSEENIKELTDVIAYEFDDDVTKQNELLLFCLALLPDFIELRNELRIERMERYGKELDAEMFSVVCEVEEKLNHLKI